MAVRPDRAAWLAWAGQNGVHPSVIALARAHEKIFDSVPPRSFTYASSLLCSMQPSELADATLVRDVLAGGRWVVQGGRHVDQDAIVRRYKQALAELREFRS